MGTGSLKLLTIEQVAELLQVPRGYVYRLNYENRIPGLVRLGHRTVRYRAEEIERWLAEGCPAPPEKAPQWLDKIGGNGAVRTLCSK